MSRFPPLTRWETTAHGLHRVAQILGAFRMLTLERVPNYLELSLVIRPEGLSTGSLPGIGEIELDTRSCTVIYRPSSGVAIAIPLPGCSQTLLLDRLLASPEMRGWHALAGASPEMSRAEAFLAALEVRGHPFTPRREDLASESPLRIDPGLSADYGAVLYRIFTAAARFRARLTGPMTPIVVWPEHFDLSFLWFATEQADDQHPHMNFGFAPFSDDLDRPYLYAYAYPMPERFEQLPLPEGATWHTEGWQGMVYPYDTLAASTDPDGQVEAIFAQIDATLAPSCRPLASATRG